MIYFLIVSYLIGSISSAIIICKIVGLPDPRTQGSKNPGATNVLRFGGKKIAAFVLIFDGLKGAIPVIIANYFGLSLFELTFILLFAFLGHVFPLYLWLQRRERRCNLSWRIDRVKFFCRINFFNYLAYRSKGHKSFIYCSTYCNTPYHQSIFILLLVIT